MHGKTLRSVAFATKTFNHSAVRRIIGLAALTVCLAFAAFMEAVNLRYIVLTHSLAPFWDAWDNITPSQLLGNLFAHHNEHRIVVSRLLILADTYLNHGRETFLIAATHVTIALNGCLMGYLGRRLLGGGKLMQASLSLSFTGFFLSLQQGNMLEWGFMVCWPLVYAFSISSYVVLFESEVRWPYIGTFILAVLSALSLANGTLSLVPVAVLAIFLRDSRMFVFATVSSVLLLAIHFWGLEPSQQTFDGGPLLHATAILKYALAYIGSPLTNLIKFLLMTGPDPLRMGGPGPAGVDPMPSIWIGCALVLAFAAVSLPTLVTRRVQSGSLALMALCGFVIVSAIATALGRIVNGLSSAMDGRYGMGATLFTAALGLLLAEALLKRWRFAPALAGAAVLALMIGSAFHQVHIADRDREWANLRKLPAAALLSGVDDQFVMGLSYPWQQQFSSLVAEVAANHLALFADEWSGWLGKQLPVPLKPGVCLGHFDGRQAVESEPGAFRVYGWASTSGHHLRTLRLVFTDQKRLVVGYGFTGWLRPDMPPNIRSKYTGWFGYVRPGAGEPLTTYLLLDDNKVACPLQ